MNYIDSIRAKVADERSAKTFSDDLAANMSVIENRIRSGRTTPFTLYGGGDAAVMAKELRARGLSCSVDGDMISAKF